MVQPKKGNRAYSVRVTPAVDDAMRVIATLVADELPSYKQGTPGPLCEVAWQWYAEQHGIDTSEWPVTVRVLPIVAGGETAKLLERAIASVNEDPRTVTWSMQAMPQAAELFALSERLLKSERHGVKLVSTPSGMRLVQRTSASEQLVLWAAVVDWMESLLG
jgi:hypothetical protein